MADEIINIGNVEIIALSDADLAFPPGNFFPTVPAETWNAHREYLGADGNLHPNAGCFVVRSSGQKIMVDTGYGPGLTGRLFDEMRAKGVNVEDISTVTFTHLHPDHVGWNMVTENGSSYPAFPNARYLMPKADFDSLPSRKIWKPFSTSKSKCCLGWNWGRSITSSRRPI